MSIPALSVIIPSYRRAGSLVNALRSLEAQSFRDFEVIVVLDGPNEAATQKLAETRFALALRVVQKDHGGRAQAYNAGAAVANAGILVFMDDDMRFLPTGLAMHALHHEAIPGSILGGCPLEELSAMKTDFQRFRARASEKWAKATATSKRRLDSDSLILMAANCSFPRDIFESVGGFDGRLTSCVDWDLAMRAYDAGIPIYFDPDLVGWHDDFITCASYISRWREYTRALEALSSLKPGLCSKFKIRAPAPLTGLKRYWFLFFSRSLWISTIDGFNWLLVLPECIRYRIYAYVVAGLGVHFKDVKLPSKRLERG